MMVVLMDEVLIAKHGILWKVYGSGSKTLAFPIQPNQPPLHCPTTNLDHPS